MTVKLDSYSNGIIPTASISVSFPSGDHSFFDNAISLQLRSVFVRIILSCQHTESPQMPTRTKVTAGPPFGVVLSVRHVSNARLKELIMVLCLETTRSKEWNEELIYEMST